MSKGQKLSSETRCMICELWDGGIHNKKEISRRVGVSDFAVTTVLKSRDEKKYCPKCRRESNAFSRFCWYCGSDVRSEKQIISDKILNLRALIHHLPENLKAGFDADTKAVMDYLERKEK